MLSNWISLKFCRLGKSYRVNGYFLVGLFWYSHSSLVNSLQSDKTINWPNFKASADDNLKVATMAKLVFDRVENIAEKEKMLVTSIFSFSRNVFKSLLSQGREPGLCGKGFTKAGIFSYVWSSLNLINPFPHNDTF